jgi:hypothetical protein
MRITTGWLAIALHGLKLRLMSNRSQKFMELRGVDLLQLMRAKQLHDRIEECCKIVGKYTRTHRRSIASGMSNVGISKTVGESHAIVFDFWKLNERMSERITYKENIVK